MESITRVCIGTVGNGNITLSFVMRNILKMQVFSSRDKQMRLIISRDKPRRTIQAEWNISAKRSVR